MLENRDLSGTEHPIELRSVCKFEFVHCGGVEKKRALNFSKLSHGALTKFENTVFQIAKVRFSKIFQKKTDS